MPSEECRSLGCARCGDCCESISLSTSLESLTQWTTAALADTPDPATDEGWEWWLAGSGWSDEMRAWAIEEYNPAGPRRANADFLTEHWHAIPDKPDRYTCDRFDPVHRVCRAHDSRPPVCSGYPWYGEDPHVRSVVAPLSTGSRCSYLLDIGPSERPENTRPLIPVEVIRKEDR